jgi:hypothetical protein
VKLKKLLVAATVTSALGLGALGVGGGMASADPPPWVPGPGPGHDGPGHDNGPAWRNNNNWRGADWQRGRDGDFNVGGRDWWRGRPGKWWRDDDLPPWGFWGPPPAVQWAGAPPWVDPHPINYWGYNATPVWNAGFNGWGIWLFGIWIPIVGIQGY